MDSITDDYTKCLDLYCFHPINYGLTYSIQNQKYRKYRNQHLQQI